MEGRFVGDRRMRREVSGSRDELASRFVKRPMGEGPKTEMSEKNYIKVSSTMVNISINRPRSLGRSRVLTSQT